MFQSYKYINHTDEEIVGRKGKYQPYSVEYELTDSDFGTVSGVAVDGDEWVNVAIAVIQEYSKIIKRLKRKQPVSEIEMELRKLNVAKNLMLAFVWHNKKYLNWHSIQQLIDYNKKYNPLFSQYEEELQKYLILL